MMILTNIFHNLLGGFPDQIAASRRAGLDPRTLCFDASWRQQIPARS